MQYLHYRYAFVMPNVTIVIDWYHIKDLGFKISKSLAEGGVKLREKHQ